MAGLNRSLLPALGAIVVLALTAGSAAAATPSAGSTVLYLRGAFALGGQQVTVPHRAVRVEGTVSPYVPGQWVQMHVYLNGHLIHTYGLPIKHSAKGKHGQYSYRVFSPGPGTVKVVVSHQATSALAAFAATHRFTVLNPSAGFGAGGAFVRLIQRRLAALHLYIPQTGVFDAGTGLALDAYHRLLGWGTYQTLDGRTVTALLNGSGQFHVRFPNEGRHAEGDLSDQLLALIDGSKVVWIFPISSGKPSTPTILGNFHVYRRVPGYLPDGMYYSDFFYTGYAIHGYNPAPDYPASHGCMRLPIVDAIPAFNWLAMGDAVNTYYT